MRKYLFGCGTLLALCWALSADFDASAANWARFRGPNGDGTAGDSGIPVEWSDQGGGIVWRVPIPGAGNSSPIVWGDKIFLESAAADGKERMLLCLSTADGKKLWSKSISGSKAKIHNKNSQASATPATDGERVYCAFWDGKNVSLQAYDFKGGKLWERDLGSFKSQHGHGSSPIVHGDLVFYNHDQDGDAKIVAVDAKKGTVVWSKTRTAFRTCYSTPLVHESSAGPELIVASTAGLTSYNPKNGTENWVYTWDFGGGMSLRTVGSPIISNGLALATSGDGSGARGMIAVKLGGKGDISKTGLAWENNKSFPYVPTMLTLGEHIYFVNDGGIAACHEAKTGREIWKERLSGAFSASPVLIDNKVYAPSEDGSVYVFAASPTYKMLARNTIGGRLMATPAVADNRLYIRSEKELICIGKK
jgi:outer membrane protein assembly factor BamB